MKNNYVRKIVISVVILLMLTVVVTLNVSAGGNSGGVGDSGGSNSTTNVVNSTVVTITPVPQVIENTFKVAPTVGVRPLNGEIKKGSDGYIELYLENPGINKVVLTADVHIYYPSEMDVYAQDIRVWGAGEKYGKFEITPGTSRTVIVGFRPIGVETILPAGNYPVKFVIVYYPKGNEYVAQETDFAHTFKVLPVLTPTPTQISTPVPINTPISSTSGTSGGQIYSYDNINVDHTITLCNPASDDEYAMTGIREKNCGNPDLTLNNYPLDLFPSGGTSGKVSASEMIMVKVRTNGHISLVPWETQPVTMSWHNGDGKLMYSVTSQADSFDNEVSSYIGHFSHEINKPGKYYIDVYVMDFGSARVVFNVVDNGRIAVPNITYTATPTVTATVTATPTVTATLSPTVTYTATVTATRMATPTPTRTVSPTPTPVVTDGDVIVDQCIWCDMGDLVGTTAGNFIKGASKAIWRVFFG